MRSSVYKTVYDLNRSTLEARKTVAYTIVRGDKLATSRLFRTITIARQAAYEMNMKKDGHRVQKTIFVHP